MERPTSFDTRRTLATCESCGSHFRRHPRETWRRLCLQCWRYSRAAQGLQLARNALRGTDHCA